MAKSESIQKKLQRVRPPRVQLSYDVEIGDAVEQKELPFVVGVLGDFSGNPEAPLPRLRDRKFVSIDGDNFDDVMKGMAPRTVFRAPNTLSETGGELGIELKFESMEDFRPESVVQQIDPLKKLLEARNKLADLRGKLAGNEKLDDILQQVLTSTEQLASIRQETGAKE
jgi:type VI secretion system protein ImpB